MPRSDLTIRNAFVWPWDAARNEYPPGAANVIPSASRIPRVRAARRGIRDSKRCMRPYLLLAPRSGSGRPGACRRVESAGRFEEMKTGIPFRFVADEIIVHWPVSESG